MARIHQTVTIKKTKTRRKKETAHKQYIKCTICGGKGYLKNWRSS